MMHLYSDHDPYACAWTRNLVDAGVLSAGVVDDRSIRDLTPEHLAGYGRVNLFSGISGWPLALRHAGFPDDRECWTGSPPCQPFSSSGARRGKTDDRHLWPEMFRLVRGCRPPTIFGEQVPDAIRHGWLDALTDDLTSLGYRVAAVVFPASAVAAPHIRARLYWAATLEQPHDRHPPAATRNGAGVPPERGPVARIRPRLEGGADPGRPHDREPVVPRPAGCRAVGLGHPPGQREGPLDGLREGEDADGGGGAGFWDRADHLACGDGKVRRTGPGLFPLAAKLPRDVRPLVARLVELGHRAGAARRLVADARRNRLGRLRGYGNALTVEQAALFVRAFLDAE